MRWFKHDSDARSDAKLERVIMKYGMQGYGLYWYCIELIAANVDERCITFELEHDAEVISHRTGINYELVQEMMTYMVKLNLFENQNGMITCLTLAKRLDQSMSSNPNMRSIIKKLKGGLIQNHDSVMPQSCKTRLDKNRAEENRLEKKTLDKTNMSNSASPHLTGLQDNEVNQEIEKVFMVWQSVMNHPKSILDQKRRGQVRNALKMWSSEDLIKAIHGCAATPYNMGQNESGVIYDSLDLIFRDAEHVEKFIRHCDSPPIPQNKIQRNHEDLKSQIQANKEAAK